MHDSVPPVITNDDNVQHQSSTSSTTASQNKKPRHRHSPAQLAALNELFDRNEHPSLDDRSSLADKLGMETKTVNAWFQNKRASTKKRNKTNPHPPPSSQVQNTPSEQDGTSSTSTNLPSISTLLNPLSGTSPAYSSTSSAHSHNNTHSHPPIFSTKELQDYTLDNDLHHSGVTTMGPEESGAALQGSFFAGTPETLPQRFFTENDVASNGRRMRMRPTSEQTEELRKAYNNNPHPSKDEREELGEKLGMRYQSITNWFQNQRSLAKKRKDDDVDSSSSSAPTSKHARTHSYYEDDHPDRRDHDSYRREHDPDRRHHVMEEHERIPRTHNLSGLSSGHPVAHRSSISSLLNAEDRLSLPPSFPPSFSPFRPYPPSPRRRGNSTRRSVTPYHLSPSVFSAGRPRDLGHGVHGREHRSMSQTDSVAFERVLHPEAALTRPRRTRPEPYQLEALKKLFMRTSNPSIEERTALASEVGMDVGKVTNWFRNLRQTARKRAKKAEGGRTRRGRGGTSSAGASRSGTPWGVSSSGSSSVDYDFDIERDYEDIELEFEKYNEGDEDTAMDLTYDGADEDDGRPGSGSEEDYQEAVTPDPGMSPSPPPKRQRNVGMNPVGIPQEVNKPVGMSGVVPDVGVGMAVGVGMGTTATYSGVKLEDALLLLSFHHHVVH